MFSYKIRCDYRKLQANITAGVYCYVYAAFSGRELVYFVSPCPCGKLDSRFGCRCSLYPIGGTQDACFVFGTCALISREEAGIFCALLNHQKYLFVQTYNLYTPNTDFASVYPHL